MPELPEIEHLRRSLEPALLGAKLSRVRLHRRDVLRINGDQPGSRTIRHAAAHLLRGSRIERLERRGKQLAVITNDHRALCVHLGMSGQLRYVPEGRRLERRDHIHCTWWVETDAAGSVHGRLHFRDPRRFGGLWAFETVEALHESRWGRLGPDALSITTKELMPRCKNTTRAIKSVLLDQTAIAGVGNIYADEALFTARIHPATVARSLTSDDVSALLRALQRVLREATGAGGSTVQDYLDGGGQRGGYATRHRVYGQSGQPCSRCHATLQRATISQRTTSYCPSCQPING